ncbi:MAG: hypothetical protein AAF480_00640 [Actinomycetota bacterium]
MTDIVRRSVRTVVPPALSLGAAGLWVGLATSNPTLTYHFAPLIVGLAWPIGHRSMRGRAGVRSGAVVAGAALAVAVATTLALWAADRMAGPTFLSDGGAVWEALLFSALGAAWGFRSLTRSRAGVLVG